MAVDFEIIVGTYEQFLLGYKIQNVDSTYKLERSFATHSHLASIRTVASNRHYLASAGADDSVYLYDMRYRIESGRLMHHSDTVNCITFTPDGSHILTASGDGSIGIVRCGNWILEKHWNAPHKGNAVNALAVHPTGKLAMSAGGDGVLRTWNLVKGRQAYATNLVPRLKLDAKDVMIIRWSPSGEKYLIVSNSRIDVYSIETAGLCAEMSFDSKVICVEFIKDDLLAIGHEDGKVRFHDLSQGSNTLEIAAHDTRVKCLAHRDNYLVSASSSGEIKLWRYAKKRCNMLSRATCGVRITCLTLTQPCPDLTVKKEEIKIEEEVESSKKNVFRMRQEVIIEDEGEDNSVAIVKNVKKGNKKSNGKKREAEVVIEADESTKTSNNNKKKKQKVTLESASIVSPKKKRSLSIDNKKIQVKKSKREGTKIISNDLVTEIQNEKLVDSEVATSRGKKKKKPKNVAIIEKPSKPVLKKRKQQNAISSATTGFPSKTKKKKLTR